MCKQKELTKEEHFRHFLVGCCLALVFIVVGAIYYTGEHKLNQAISGGCLLTNKSYSMFPCTDYNCGMTNFELHFTVVRSDTKQNHTICGSINVKPSCYCCANTTKINCKTIDLPSDGACLPIIHANLNYFNSFLINESYPCWQKANQPLTFFPLSHTREYGFLSMIPIGIVFLFVALHEYCLSKSSN